MKSKLIGFLAMLLSFPAFASDNLLIGVQDYTRSAIVVVREYQGLAIYLSHVLKQPVRIEHVKTYSEYLKKAQAKRFAFMFGPPSMIMQAHKFGYTPVAKIPGLLSASFMSLSKTGIAFPEDMKGKRIGMYEKDSMITQLALAQLKSENIDLAKHFKSVTYYSDANAVLFAMQANLIDVGVANSTLFNNWTNRGNDLTLILQGKGVPHLTFSVRNDLPESTKEAVTQALLKAEKDTDAQDYFKYSGFASFEPAKLSDYNDLVKLLQIK